MNGHPQTSTSRPSARSAHGRRAAPRRGAAALAVVMVLFFIISLVAAYTSRNLIFEQRTSANQYRSTLAFEVADAGVEWALARLNEARMNDNCTPLTNPASVSSPAQPSFRERYLEIDTASGAIDPVANMVAGCVFNGAAWSCDCPATPGTNPAPVFTAAGPGPYSAFWLRFQQVPERAGVVRVQVNACTRNAADCLRFDRIADSGDGVATVWTLLALKGAVTTPVVAPLTVRGNFALGVGANLSLTNIDVAAQGITLHAGTAASVAGVSLSTLPGVPPLRSVITGDAVLAAPDLSPPLAPATPANTGTNRMFNSVFGVWPETYFAQPALAVVPCAGGCDASDVNDAANLYPGRALHVTGSGPLRVDTTIGSATKPLVLVLDGSLEFTGTPATVYGLVYSRATTWTTAGIGFIIGAAVAENDFTANGTQLVIYDSSKLTAVRVSAGSFVKVPGGWRDYQP